MGDPMLPPGCSDNDDYFDVPNADGAYKPARQRTAPYNCEVCNVAPIYIRNIETKVWHCLQCAFKAGEPTAAIWMAHKTMDELLLKPTIDEGEAA